LASKAEPFSPDESLTADESFTATSSAGLTYPWGTFAPGPGEAFRIAEGISWARIPMPGSLGHINSWILDDHDGGVAPVDTGLRLQSCSDAWLALFKGDLKDRPITRVFATHLHPDHVGLAGWLVKKDNLEIWMTRGEWLMVRLLLAEHRDGTPPEEIRLFRSAGWSEEQMADVAAKGWGGFAKVTHPLPLGYRRIKDGDVLDIGGNDWRVVVGSGHSPEHACLLNETSRVLVAGDQVLPRISSNVSVGPMEPEADPLGEWLTSIDKLLLLPDDLLVCPAHGEPFHGLHTRLKALRDEHHGRLDRVAEAMKAGPMRAVDCFGLLFNRAIGDDNRPLASGEALAHLRRLELDGRATRENRDGVYWYHAA
jgi:glyoxylase-like metal-dependent hydrolase (beta-lactamase superfamily II)